jgi:hypothetical protein
VPIFLLLRLHYRENYYDSLNRDARQAFNYGTFDTADHRRLFDASISTATAREGLKNVRMAYFVFESNIYFIFFVYGISFQEPQNLDYSP